MSNKPVIKAARSGYDVETADEKYLTLDSSKNTLKQYQEYTGTLSNTTSSGSDYDTINHALGYQPMVLAYVDIGQDGIYTRVPLLRETAGSIFSDPTFTHVYIKRPDSNNIRIYLDTESRSYTARDLDADYKVYVYLDPKEDIWYE